MTRKLPCILVYNPISGHGHLDSWNALVVCLLLERGFRVLALAPDRNALETRLDRRKLLNHSRLHVLDWSSTLPSPRLKMWLRHILQWWQVYGNDYANKRPETRIQPGMCILTRIKKRIFQIVVPPLFMLSQAMRGVYRVVRGAKRLKPDSHNPLELHFLKPVEMAQRIKIALRKARWRPNCMFNMYLDMYKTDAQSWQEFAAICQLPWGGIRFVPSKAPPREGYYALPSLRGICLLDEAACVDYRANMSGKSFQFLPDMTHTELPDDSSSLAETIKRRAAGRKVVLLGGSIGGQKNIARWCELIAIADPERWFFAQVGELHVNTFTREDTDAFEKLIAIPHENLLQHTQYLPEERDFNAVIDSADILFAAYRDFRISSNMLGKAAYFEKPILVSQGFLMDKRVSHYGIGLAVPQDDAKAMLRAMERLVTVQVPAKRFAAYRASFSETTAGDSLEDFFENIAIS